MSPATFGDFPKIQLICYCKHPLNMLAPKTDMHASLCCGLHLDQPPPFAASVLAFQGDLFWHFEKKSARRAFLSDRFFSNGKLGLKLHKSFDRCRKGRISDSFCSSSSFFNISFRLKGQKVEGHQPLSQNVFTLDVNIFQNQIATKTNCTLDDLNSALSVIGCSTKEKSFDMLPYSKFNILLVRLNCFGNAFLVRSDKSKMFTVTSIAISVQSSPIIKPIIKTWPLGQWQWLCACTYWLLHVHCFYGIAKCWNAHSSQNAARWSHFCFTEFSSSF